MINLNYTPQKMTGGDYLKSFPDSEEDKKNPETLKNVLLNSLAIFPIRQRKDIFLVNKIANDIVKCEDGKLELNGTDKKFLETVLLEATYRQEGEKNEVRGAYFPYLISQILKELGIEE